VATKKCEIRRHTIDRRAGRLADEIEANGQPDDVFITTTLARLLDVSPEFLEVGRTTGPSGGYGPKFLKIGSSVGYERRAVVRWLRERARIFETSKKATKQSAFADRVVCR
jgi:hypothetical protein